MTDEKTGMSANVSGGAGPSNSQGHPLSAISTSEERVSPRTRVDPQDGATRVKISAACLVRKIKASGLTNQDPGHVASLLPEVKEVPPQFDFQNSTPNQGFGHGAPSTFGGGNPPPNPSSSLPDSQWNTGSPGSGGPNQNDGQGWNVNMQNSAQGMGQNQRGGGQNNESWGSNW
jgi:hypothetical protein